MQLPLLVVISGPPCSGKTTLARAIRDRFHLPLFSKDAIKELLFDTLGWSDRPWSKKLSGVSYDLMYQYITAQVMTGHSLIIEGDLKPEDHTERLQHVKKVHPFYPFQIQCQSDGNVLFERFRERSERGSRHPGHVDHTNYDELRPLLVRGRFEPMHIGGEVHMFDTSDYSQVKYEPLLHRLEVAIHKIRHEHPAMQQMSN